MPTLLEYINIYILYTLKGKALLKHMETRKVQVSESGAQHPSSVLCTSTLATGISKFFSHFWKFFSQIFFICSPIKLLRIILPSVLVWDNAAPHGATFWINCTNFWMSRTGLQIQQQEGHSDRKLPWITPCDRGNDTASPNVFPMLFCIFCSF